eukprot:202596-Prymnesium_polylepis.1
MATFVAVTYDALSVKMAPPLANEYPLASVSPFKVSPPRSWTLNTRERCSASSVAPTPSDISRTSRFADTVI